MISTWHLIPQKLLLYAIAGGFLLAPASSGQLEVGVNVVNPMRASVANQNALIDQLKAAHVRLIRAPLSPDDKAIDFVKRVYAQGIRIEFQLSPQFPPNAPTRPYQPKEFPNMWGGHPLSFADPQLSKIYFQSVMDKLEANGIVLAGLELGNEINWTAFNPEFPLPGKGMNFGLDDLYYDPEAKQIAKGYLQYLKILAQLKDVRDHSKLNHHTPIILAGLADDGAEGLRRKSKTDSVSINATVQFLRANGLDKLVDAYGIHTYPVGEHPRTPQNAFGKVCSGRMQSGKFPRRQTLLDYRVGHRHQRHVLPAKRFRARRSHKRNHGRFS